MQPILSCLALRLQVALAGEIGTTLVDYVGNLLRFFDIISNISIHVSCNLDD